MKLRFTPSARDQFLSAVAYILQDNPAAAVKFRRNAEKSLKKLEAFPSSGRQLPEFPTLPFRETIVTPYRFFYRVENKTIWVVAVWHGAQLPEEPRETAT